MKVLFLIKKNGTYGTYSAMTSKSGLLNSAKFLLQALLYNKIIKQGKIELCDDGNSIDKAVHLFKPDICIIEALWVTPAKLAENERLHPTVKFIVRIHSNIPFLAMEGIAIDWIRQYKNVAFNNEMTVKYMDRIIKNPIYLPNIDDKMEIEVEENNTNQQINIACFGSIRPLKNQLIQAVAAINYGDKYGRTVHFHINASRIEQNGDPVLKNIESLFQNSRHKLIKHSWSDHPNFINLIRQMDIGLQTSFTESFNIVSADFVHTGIPIIVSPEISWQTWSLVVNPNDADMITDKINEVLCNPDEFTTLQTYALKKYNRRAIKVWKTFITELP